MRNHSTCPDARNDDVEARLLPETSHTPSPSKHENSGADSTVVAWSSRTSLRRAAVCSAVCVQFAMFALLRSHVHVDDCDATILGTGEVMKFAVSLAVSRLLAHPTRLAASHHIGDVLACTPPVMCFTAMNLLAMWSLRRIDATTFVIVMQLKLVFTAVCARAILSRRMSCTKWLSVVGIVVGCSQFVLSERTAGGVVDDARDAASSRSERLTAVLCLVLETILSALSSTYMQKMFASDVTVMWTRNVHLAWMGTILYALSGSRQEGCALFPTSLTSLALATCSAWGGVMVALSLVYSGAVEKTIATTCSIVLTGVAEHALFTHTAPTTEKALSGLSVVLFVLLFTTSSS